MDVVKVEEVSLQGHNVKERRQMRSCMCHTCGTDCIHGESRRCVACLLRLSLSLFDTQLDVQGQTSRHGFLAARMIQRIETHKKRMAQHGALGFQHVLRIKPIDVRRTDLTVQYGVPLRSFAKNSSDGMFIAFHALDLARGCSSLFLFDRNQKLQGICQYNNLQRPVLL